MIRMAKEYTAKNLEVMEGLEAVRLRPGMYIGSTGPRGLHHLLWEIVDNAIDEAANNYADKVDIIIHSDDSATVIDNGRGIPVDINPKSGLTGVELVYTKLHAGGKFNYDNYAYSGGLHGVGASVVNALSKWLEVEVHLGGKIYRQRFESKEDKKTKKIKSGIPVTPLKVTGKTKITGSKITFMPDDRIFTTISLEFDTVNKRLKELAFLNKGVTITFTDERSKDKSTLAYKFDGGLNDFVQYLNENKRIVSNNIMNLSGEHQGIHAEVAIQYTDSYTDSIYSFVNNIPTTEGGSHETGFKTAVTKVFNDYARRLNYLNGKDKNLNGEDFREGMTALISLKMHDIQFEGQTKTKLGNPEARTAMETIITQQLIEYMNKRENEESLKTILGKAISASKAREAARKAKEISRKKSTIEGAPLVGKLASCTGRKAMDNELFIVEGDSAGGSAKQGRDRHFQAILPLRGKPLNVEKTRLSQVLANEELRSLITALGTGIGDDFNIKNLKYGKVIILSDADQDGAHIRAILLTFFFRFMKELISEGHMYIGLSPLYKISRGKKVLYAYDDEELKTAITTIGRGYAIQRYKGLGEMNPNQLWETTMDPMQRKIIQVEMSTEAERIITVLMGDKADRRRKYISENANFNKHDLFEEMGV